MSTVQPHGQGPHPNKSTTEVSSMLRVLTDRCAGQRREQPVLVWRCSGARVRSPFIWLQKKVGLKSLNHQSTRVLYLFSISGHNSIILGPSKHCQSLSRDLRLCTGSHSNNCQSWLFQASAENGWLAGNSTNHCTNPQRHPQISATHLTAKPAGRSIPSICPIELPPLHATPPLRYTQFNSVAFPLRLSERQ